MQNEKHIQVTKIVQNIKTRPNSRQRLKQLRRQQQYLSQTFKIDNFYNNQKLDINSLKNKINEIKRKSDQVQVVKQNPQDSSKKQKRSPLISLSYKIQQIYLTKKNPKKINSGVSTNRQTVSSSRYNQRNQSALSHRYYGGKKGHQHEEQDARSFQLKTRLGLRSDLSGKQKNQKYHSIDYNHKKSKELLQQQEAYGQLRSTMIPKIQNIGRRQSIGSGNLIQKSQSMRKTMQLSRLEPLGSIKKKLSLIRVQNNKQLAQFQSNVTSVWQIYQKLCQVVKFLSYESKSVLNDKITSQQFIKLLCEYKYLVCSTRLQFLVTIIDNCLEYSHAKIIIFSRLLENLSIVYIFLEIVEKSLMNGNQFSSSFLVNFVGICSNNLLLILRIISLVCFIDQQLVLSQNVNNIFRAILQFEVNSYRAEISSTKEAILRMQHNNQLVSIIQSKINNRMSTKQYHKNCFGKFVKEVLIDRLKEQIQVAGDRRDSSQGSTYSQTKPFYQYSYFLFEYLAYHLHHQQFIGLFPKQIETAPQPYLSSKKQFTLIIDPVKILTYTGKNKIYVRAYAQKFISQLKEKCNIVFWSQKMPNQVDSLYNLVDVSLQSSVDKNNKQNSHFDINSNKDGTHKIKRLYKYHCFYDYNGKGQLGLIKDILRVGCQPGKYIIIDANQQNYYECQNFNTILLPWKGEAKDSKLTIVLDILLPFLREGTDLSKGMKLLKPRLEQLLKSKVQGRRKDQFY